MKDAIHKEFCDIVDELKASKTWGDMGMSNRYLAQMLGINERTLYRWLAGDTAIPKPAMLLLKMIVKKG